MLTGTFLDEITHDIPSSNWGEEEWRRDFQSMRKSGIDTVILIRAGYKNQATFQSEVLEKEHKVLLAPEDLVGMFLRLSEECGMDFFFGTYDSGNYWHTGHYHQELELNLAFCEEVWNKYGSSPAFKGWYISHEINAFNDSMMDVYRKLAEHLRALQPLPILISPYMRGPKQFEHAFTLEDHEREWAEVFGHIRDHVDIVAFQDGHMDFEDLPNFLRINARLATEAGIRCWSNVETFDRDMPINFPPIQWRKLQFKIDAARDAGLEKLITFEFSHFMSPNSIWPAARHLHQRYMQHYLPQ